MDVVSMAIPGTHLGHPRFIILVLDAAELFFYRGIDEDPRYFWLLGRCSDEGDIGRAPSFVVDLLSIRCNQVAGQNIFPFLFAQSTIPHLPHPTFHITTPFSALISARHPTP